MILLTLSTGDIKDCGCVNGFFDTAAISFAKLKTSGLLTNQLQICNLLDIDSNC